PQTDRHDPPRQHRQPRPQRGRQPSRLEPDLPNAGNPVIRPEPRERNKPHPTSMIESEAYVDSSSCPSPVTRSISSSRTPNSCTFPCCVSSANTIPGSMVSG